MRTILFFGFGIFVFLNSTSVNAVESDVCVEFAGVLEKQITPELDTGIQKKLALALQRNDDFTISSLASLKKDLWNKSYVLETPRKKLESPTLDILRSEMCKIINTRLQEIEWKKGDKFFIVLNPSTEVTSKIMEDWTQKHVGIYKNMGLRVRWNSMSELQKSQKVFDLKTLGGGQ